MEHILADSSAEHSDTCISLSHSKKIQLCPSHLLADTSTEIAFKFIEDDELCEKYKNVRIVSNDHFDTDGLLSIFTLCYPKEALKRKQFIIDVATAGDFEKYKDRDAARASFVFEALADEKRSPFDKQIFRLKYPDMVTKLYTECIPIVLDVLDNVHSSKWKKYWKPYDDILQLTLDAFANGMLKIEDFPEIDLTVVKMEKFIPSFSRMVIHNNTKCFRTLVINGEGRYEIYYRYESNVRYQSAKPGKRMNLLELADDLNYEERKLNGNVIWEYNSNLGRLTVSEVSDEVVSRIPEDTFKKVVFKFLNSKK